MTYVYLYYCSSEYFWIEDFILKITLQDPFFQIIFERVHKIIINMIYLVGLKWS